MGSLSGGLALPATSGGPRERRSPEDPHYKWIVLSNTTLGTLLAFMNASIVLISLPAIFRGIGLNPLQPVNVGYLLWMLMGYLVVTAVLVVPFGPSSPTRSRPASAEWRWASTWLPPSPARSSVC